MHKTRRFVIGEIETPEELAKKLTQYTWCTCNGFRLVDYLALNDSTGPDGAQEYAIVRAQDMVQVESITFGWCDEKKALEYIREMLDGKFTNDYGKIDNKIETPAEHGRCGACA